jgi:hypothetical protein
MVVLAVVLAIVGVAMMITPAAFARFAHALRISIPAPDKDGRVVFGTRLSGALFLCIGMAIAAVVTLR